MSQPAIHQFGANLSFGDAISNDMVEIQASLRKFGFKSNIYAQYMDPRMAKNFNLFTDYEGDPNNIILFHASIGGDVFDYVKGLPDKKVLIYHNVTPPEFMKGYNEHLVNLLEGGVRKVADFANDVEFAVGDSDFNRRDLVAMGFDEEKTDVLPIFVDFGKYDKSLNKQLQRKLTEGGITNVLFIGRYAPNKRQDDIVKAFYIYHKYFNSDSRLILVGSYDGMEDYYLRLQKLVEMLGIEESVIMESHVPFEDLATYYKCADLFLSMSEHEGFLVPILECFHLDIPILAYKAGAVPETMGKGGMLFGEKDYLKVAEMMEKILVDKALRGIMVREQRGRLEDFKRERVEGRLKEIINRVV